jgi:hypothetical protein
LIHSWNIKTYRILLWPRGLQKTKRLALKALSHLRLLGNPCSLIYFDIGRCIRLILVVTAETKCNTKVFKSGY